MTQDLASPVLRDINLSKVIKKKKKQQISLKHTETSRDNHNLPKFRKQFMVGPKPQR